MRRCHLERHLGEMVDESTKSCKEYDGQMVTGQEIVIRRDKVFQSVEEKVTTNDVAVVLKGGQRQGGETEVTWDE